MLLVIWVIPCQLNQRFPLKFLILIIYLPLKDIHIWQRKPKYLGWLTIFDRDMLSFVMWGLNCLFLPMIWSKSRGLENTFRMHWAKWIGFGEQKSWLTVGIWSFLFPEMLNVLMGMVWKCTKDTLLKVTSAFWTFWDIHCSLIVSNNQLNHLYPC